MASLWSKSIPRSKKLREGISQLKLVSLESFEFILKKIQSKEVFRDSDLNKLMEESAINDKQTRHIIEAVSYLHKHLANLILKPTHLEEALKNDFNIEEDKASLWIKFWTEDIGQNFDLGNLNKLVNISWELNLQAASTLFRKEVVPTATIQLKGSTDNTILRLDEDELVYLFNTLENVQEKLDM